ncbi:predicted protein, partial [Thalassiosira pseudonana CCMP1335]
WLLTTSSLVFAMVHIGGITRLTKSGLSMTDWKPLGSRPPITTEEWMVEFERYKLYPEWEQRKNMNLEEFKYIYYWEWGHRMMGRVVGLVFGGGWAYFTWLHPILFAMGGTQGLVGWWMVKSGLGDDRRGDRNEIRVSPYRLASHLGMAVGTYSMLIWTGLGALSYPVDRYPASSSALQHAQRTRVGTISTVALTGCTILSGAFVAGNDAGNAYNTYPLMDGQLIPWNDMVNEDLVPRWRNMFENTATVQWNHRMLGTCTALSAVGLAGFGLLHPASRASTTPQVRRGLVALGTAATAQMSLGIATLLNYVPITLAASHQLGSLVVLTCGLYTAHSLRYAGKSVVSSV